MWNLKKKERKLHDANDICVQVNFSHSCSENTPIFFSNSVFQNGAGIGSDDAASR